MLELSNTFARGNSWPNQQTITDFRLATRVDRHRTAHHPARSRRQAVAIGHNRICDQGQWGACDPRTGLRLG